MITTVYLVRHGQTDMNVQGRCQGSLDVPMNDEGELQVAALAARLQGIRFDAAYTSPLQRAVRTARVIVGESAMNMEMVPGLSELSYGTWQGTSYDEWPEASGDLWRRSPHEMTFPEGESLADVRARVVPAFDAILRANQGKTVLIAAHGHLNRVLLGAVLADRAPSFWEIEQPNCATWRLVFDSSIEPPALLSAQPVEAPLTVEMAQRAVDSKTKPLGALGHLELVATQLSVLQQSLSPSIDKARVSVFAADHGVADEGVSAYPRAVTAEMMKNFGAGGAAINVLGRANNVDVEVIDVGVDADLGAVANIRHAKVARGSRNFAVEPAMNVDELSRAMLVGASSVHRAVRDGVRALGLGEMGIGNTTSAAAILGALTGRSARETVGLGTGISDETLEKKIAVVERAIELHVSRRDSVSARETLRRLGGLEIAAIAGAVLESLRFDIAIVADGFISTVGALCAVRIAREEQTGAAARAAQRIFFAHHSAERGYGLALDAFTDAIGERKRALLDLGMRLGEGSGAALAMPVLRSAAAIMREMATFESAGVSAGDNIDKHR
ncbi:MAG: nicotinate-nucleotide--dimethylbenzimidazole phosphoribosyltransferase [Gemmatimonas sp.]